MLRVAREYVDGVSGERLSEREEFVEALSHDCWVVQVPLLASRRRTDLERLLSVFDQELRVPEDRHVLEVNEREIPERYAPVLRRLESAAASVEVADSMALEDEVAETWGRMKRESAAKDAALAEKNAALTEKDAALEVERAERAAAAERIAETGAPSGGGRRQRLTTHGRHVPHERFSVTPTRPTEDAARVGTHHRLPPSRGTHPDRS